MQCHKYARGTCHTSHALSIAKANRLVIAYLENSVATMNFPIAPHTIKKEQAGPDYDHLISVERVKLRRIQEAYETEVYTLEEFARRKVEISAQIRKLQEQAAIANADAQRKALDPKAFSEKVRAVLEVIRDPEQDEAAKNTALKTVVSYIVYDKPAKRLAVYFYA